jgi:hypothetical protein
MPSRELSPKGIMDAVRTILNNDWDPIGVMDDSTWPQDEYDSYIGEICKFLVRGESVEFIARHLCLIEEKLMGLGSPSVQSRLHVAQKLKALNVCVQGTNS